MKKWKNRILPRGVGVDSKGNVFVRVFHDGKPLPKKSFKKATPETVDEAIDYCAKLKKGLKVGVTSVENQKAIRWPFPYAWDVVKEHLPASRVAYGVALKSYFSKYYFDDLWFHVVEGYRPFRRKQMVKQGTNLVLDSTINLELAVLSRMYHILVELKQLGKIPNVVLPPQSPTKGAKNRNIDDSPNRRKRIITGAEFKIQMEEASPRVQRQILAALNSGLRKKDIGQLRKSAWAEYMGQIEGLAAKLVSGYKSPANAVMKYLFETAEGEVVVDFTNHRTEFNALRAKCREKGMPDFIFKDYRRTAAWNVYTETKNIVLCQEFLNHKTIEMTKRYLGITMQDLKEAGDVLSRRFSHEIQTAPQTAPLATEKMTSKRTKIAVSQ